MHIICNIDGAIVIDGASAWPFAPYDTFDDLRVGPERRIVPIEPPR